MKDENALIEINPSQLDSIYSIDRADWDQETYKLALEDALHIKGYSQWVAGMLVDEIIHKWPSVTCETLSKALQPEYKPSSLRQYSMIYRKYTSKHPDFVPPSHIPWSVIAMIATSKAVNDDPVEVLNELEDSGAVTVKSAYKAIKEKETGKKLPTLPRITFRWNKENDKIIATLSVPDEEALSYVDWEDLKMQMLDKIEESKVY